MLNLIQSGTGSTRVLLIAYFVSDRAALLQSLPPSWVVLADNDNPAGRFARSPGPGGVDTLADVLLWARHKAGPFEVAGVVLVGWSAGAQAVRQQLRADVRPLAALALDGTSGSVPPTEAQIAPWQRAAVRARAGDTMLVLTHALMTYTEHLPVGERYLATVNGCRAITGWPLTEAGPLDAPVITRDGALVVASYQSATIDAQAHRDQQTHALPDMLRRFVVPYVLQRGEPSPETQPHGTPALLARGATGPAVLAWQTLLTRAGYRVVADGAFGSRTENATRALQHDAGLAEDGVVGALTRAAAEARAQDREQGGRPSLGLRALHLALAELGQHEVPGPASSARVVEYLHGCERSGRPVGLVGDEPPWCAAFAGWCDHHAAYEGERVPPWRAAVAEIWADAHTMGATRDRRYQPAPGDLAVFARAGGDPRRGGRGHVARVEFAPDASGRYTTIGGNEGGVAHHGGEVLRTTRDTADPLLVGWVVR